MNRLHELFYPIVKENRNFNAAFHFALLILSVYSTFDAFVIDVLLSKVCSKG